MNIFNFEFKSKIKSTLTWGLSSALVIFIYFAFFPTLAKEADTFNKLMENFPKEFLSMFGMGGDGFSTVVGYLGFVFAFIHLIVAIQASNYGFALLTKEEADLTADFLMTKPVSRTKIYLSKFIASILSLLLTDIFIVISLYIFIGMFRDGRPVDIDAVILITGSIFFMQIYFFSISVLISSFVKKIKSVIPFSLGLVFLFYTLAAFSKAIEDGKTSYINPFKIFDPVKITEKMEYNLISVGVIVGISLAGLIVTHIKYKNKNISSV